MSELLNQAWNNAKIKHRSPNLTSYIERSTNLSYWISTVVMQAKLETRTALFNKFIQVAQALRDLNNFHSLVAISAGLNTASVHRLKNTKAKIDKRCVQKLADIGKEMEPTQSYKSYRERLAVALPCLPYVYARFCSLNFSDLCSGVHLTDLVFIEDGNPDMREEKINYKKRMLVYGVLQMLNNFQSSTYELERVEPLYSYLEHLPCLPEEPLFELSLLLEPRGN
jgi:son of sevenless-like protein